MNAEMERGFLWLENECQDCPKCMEFIATVRAELERAYVKNRTGDAARRVSENPMVGGRK